MMAFQPRSPAPALPPAFPREFDMDMPAPPVWSASAASALTPLVSLSLADALDASDCTHSLQPKAAEYCAWDAMAWSAGLACPRTPQKVELPAEAMLWDSPSHCQAPIALGRSPSAAGYSPAAALSPAMPWQVLQPPTLLPPPFSPFAAFSPSSTLGLPTAVVELAKALSLNPDSPRDQESEDANTRRGETCFSPCSFFPPGLQPPPGSPSHGSALHGTGQCKPCAWFWKKSGCQNAKDCAHCHLCLAGEIRDRKRNKRAVMRQGTTTPRGMDGSEMFIFDSLSFTPMTEPPSLGSSPAAGSSSLESTTGSGSDHESSNGIPSDADTPVEEQEAYEEHRRPAADVGVTSGSEEASVQSGAPELPPGLGLPLGASSWGSLLHKSMDCNPCAWFWKSVGCANAQDCPYCHICPEGAVKARKKTKQAKMRLGHATTKSGANATSDHQAKHALNLASLL